MRHQEGNPEPRGGKAKELGQTMAVGVPLPHGCGALSRDGRSLTLVAEVVVHQFAQLRRTPIRDVVLGLLSPRRARSSCAKRLVTNRAPQLSTSNTRMFTSSRME